MKNGKTVLFSKGSPRVLMCAPSHYDIRYEINPWMKISNTINRSIARRQWRSLYTLLRRLGVSVILIPQKKGNPDMVFTANAGVAKGNVFIPSHFRYIERQEETGAFVRFFKRRGYRVVDAARRRFFEGEGDLLPQGNRLWGGYHYRSERGAHEQVSSALKKHLLPLQLVDPHFYHLDTCFFPLDDRTVLYYPQAFDAQGRDTIRRHVKNAIAVSPEDARRFACNAFRVGRTVVMNQASRNLKRRLKALGYQVAESPTSEFIKAGGSVKCLLLQL